MGINVEAARSQANRLSQYASTLNEVYRNLESLRVNLNQAWQADEMTYINAAITQMLNELSVCSSSLSSIGSDVYAVALEIKHEEEVRAAEERARQQRLLQELLSKQQKLF
ncbi:hypothetical protein B5M42_000840 [Paenibacillus athensensis]|uniref:hypothetical protein n=1 Tax=Paenibacillus athensensis TaxID=1967502 RepID=UPI00106F1BEA|nr:hypothetical protein [Paenibacillus athensensis]MCD1257381.1 hypothetical protein [Paenibacillus athensensis]